MCQMGVVVDFAIKYVPANVLVNVTVNLIDQAMI